MNAKQFAALCLTLLVIPEAALAHSPIEGLGNFYNGLLHPVLVPSHLLLLVAIGIFIGQQGQKVLQPAIGTFAFATIAGLTVAWFSAIEGTEALVLVLSAVIGLVIAIAPNVPLIWCGAIALMAGFFLGIDSAQEELSGMDKLVTLFGNAVAIYFIVLYPMALANRLNKKEWQKIGMRVVGSWIAASSLLVLALSFAPQAQA